jgi:hypothetical protein
VTSSSRSICTLSFKWVSGVITGDPPFLKPLETTIGAGLNKISVKSVSEVNDSPKRGLFRGSLFLVRCITGKVPKYRFVEPMRRWVSDDQSKGSVDFHFWNFQIRSFYFFTHPWHWSKCIDHQLVSNWVPSRRSMIEFLVHCILSNHKSYN